MSQISVCLEVLMTFATDTLQNAVDDRDYCNGINDLVTKFLFVTSDKFVYVRKLVEAKCQIANLLYDNLQKTVSYLQRVDVQSNMHSQEQFFLEALSLALKAINELVECNNLIFDSITTDRNLSSLCGHLSLNNKLLQQSIECSNVIKKFVDCTQSRFTCVKHIELIF